MLSVPSPGIVCSSGGIGSPISSLSSPVHTLRSGGSGRDGGDGGDGDDNGVGCSGGAVDSCVGP